MLNGHDYCKSIRYLFFDITEATGSQLLYRRSDKTRYFDGDKTPQKGNFEVFLTTFAT